MNFNALVGAVQSELNDYSARSKTRIEKWVNECHRSICQSRRWSFLVVRESDTMTIGTADMPINIETDIEVGSSAVAAQNVLSIYDVTDGTYEYIQMTTLDQLRDSFPTDYGQAGVPDFWYYLDNKNIQFFPTLEEDRDFIFSFQKKLSTYATGAATALLIPDEYVDVLHELVLYKAYRYKTDDRANACLENYTMLIDAMIKAESNKTGIIYDQPRLMPARLPLLSDDS
jgi:hypothetical protein